MKPKPNALGERLPPNEKLRRQLFTEHNAYQFGECVTNSEVFDRIGRRRDPISFPHDYVSDFKDMNLHPWIMDNISLFGYCKPTPVQHHVIPILLKKMDLLAVAPTGFGKTAAFLVPMIQNIIELYSRKVITWSSLQKCHQEAMEILTTAVVEDLDEDKSWKVTIATNGSQRSFVIELKPDICSCLTCCRYCGVCPKMYMCQCDAYKNETCGHIHLVQMHCNSYHYCAPQGLVLAETRELARQIHKEALKFTYRIPLKCGIVYGGKKTRSQRKTEDLLLKDGCDILIATPARLITLLDEGSVWLHQCRFLVLDDCDRTLDTNDKRGKKYITDDQLKNCLRYDDIWDLGFEEQVRIIVKLFDMPERGVRQTALLTATLPLYLAKKQKKYLKAHGEISIKLDEELIHFKDWRKYIASQYLCRNYAFIRVVCSLQSAAHEMIWTEDKYKTSFTSQLLTNNPNTNCRTIIFFNKIRECKEVADSLRNTLLDTVDTAILPEGYYRWCGACGEGCPILPAAPSTVLCVLHGGMCQVCREWSLKLFCGGNVTFLCATDAVSRGLDIPNVDHIINYELPAEKFDVYVRCQGNPVPSYQRGRKTNFAKPNSYGQQIDKMSDGSSIDQKMRDLKLRGGGGIGRYQQFIQRVGRTGRCGRKGKVTTLFSETDLAIGPYLYQLLISSKQVSPFEIPEWLIKLAEAYFGPPR